MAGYRIDMDFIESFYNGRYRRRLSGRYISAINWYGREKMKGYKYDTCTRIYEQILKKERRGK